MTNPSTLEAVLAATKSLKSNEKTPRLDENAEMYKYVGTVLHAQLLTLYCIC